MNNMCIKQKADNNSAAVAVGAAVGRQMTAAGRHHRSVMISQGALRHKAAAGEGGAERDED